VCLTGFTTINDVAFDKRGTLYVLEYPTIFPSAAEGGDPLRTAARVKTGAYHRSSTSR